MATRVTRVWLLIALLVSGSAACFDNAEITRPPLSNPGELTSAHTTVTCDSGWEDNGSGGSICNGTVEMCSDGWYNFHGTCEGYDPVVDLCFPYECGGGGTGGGGGGAPACNDERDTMIGEYNSMAPGLPTPSCGSFTRTSSNPYYGYSQLTVNSPHSWAIIRSPLQIGSNATYGLARWIVEIDGVPRTLNSVYRCPHKNAQVGGAPSSRQMAGDAVDLDVSSNGYDEWKVYADAAWRAGASYVEPTNLPCGTNCTHADWRNR